MERAYAQAAYESLESGMSLADVLAGLDRALARNGHTKLKVHALKALLILLEKSKEAGAKLIVAKEGDKDALAARIKAAETELDTSITETQVDETLVGGFVLETGSARVDASYKRALVTLYRNIITHTTN